MESVLCWPITPVPALECGGHTQVHSIAENCFHFPRIYQYQIAS